MTAYQRATARFIWCLILWIGGGMAASAYLPPGWSKVAQLAFVLGFPALVILVLGPRIEMGPWSITFIPVPVFGWLVGARALWRASWLPASNWEGGWVPLPGLRWRVVGVIGIAFGIVYLWPLAGELGATATSAEDVAIRAVGGGTVVHGIEVDGTRVVAVHNPSAPTADSYRAVFLTPERRPLGTRWERAGREPERPGCNGYVGETSVCLWVAPAGVARIDVRFVDLPARSIPVVNRVALFTLPGDHSRGVEEFALLDATGRPVAGSLRPKITALGDLPSFDSGEGGVVAIVPPPS